MPSEESLVYHKQQELATRNPASTEPLIRRSPITAQTSAQSFPVPRLVAANSLASLAHWTGLHLESPAQAGQHASHRHGKQVVSSAEWRPCRAKPLQADPAQARAYPAQRRTRQPWQLPAFPGYKVQSEHSLHQSRSGRALRCQKPFFQGAYGDRLLASWTPPATYFPSAATQASASRQASAPAASALVIASALAAAMASADGVLTEQGEDSDLWGCNHTTADSLAQGASSGLLEDIVRESTRNHRASKEHVQPAIQGYALGASMSATTNKSQNHSRPETRALSAGGFSVGLLGGKSKLLSAGQRLLLELCQCPDYRMQQQAIVHRRKVLQEGWVRPEDQIASLRSQAALGSVTGSAPVEKALKLRRLQAQVHNHVTPDRCQKLL